MVPGGAGDGFDYDWVVVGSGFGGSVSALRLAEKGHSVLVLEQGRRWRDSDFARSGWDARRIHWAPWLGMRGILRLTAFRHVSVISGTGVGGGSLVYANTTYVPHSDDFYRHPQWASIANWRRTLAPHYETAQRMLGVTGHDSDGPSERLLQGVAEDLGVPDAYRTTPVAVFFGEPGVEVEDPYFGGAGPPRAGCRRCGRCLLGCRYGAKNTLPKNYLWLAERLGARIHAERRVVDLRPAGWGDGSDGWEVAHVRTAPALRSDRRTVRARGVVVAAGTIGTNDLLLRCRRRGSLPRLSPRLGDLVRTNSETITASTARDRDADYTGGIAITASIYPDERTHVTNNTYGEAGDAFSFMFTPLIGPGTRLTRPLKLVWALVRRPLAGLRSLNPVGWSRRTVIFTTMQSADTSLRLRLRGRRVGRGPVLDTEEGASGPSASAFIPLANTVAQIAARRMGGDPQSSLLDALRGTPSTAHFLGGAAIGSDPSRGVVDGHLRAYGYSDLIVCDGSVVPANPGVNPSLTITALAEHAISQVPEKEGRPGRP
jgi:cholesterol oxidase